MKKILIILGILIVLIIGTLAILPSVFKDEIKTEIDKVLASSVNADVYFDEDGFGLTFFRNFPNPTVYMTEFGIIGRDEFQDIPLVDMRSFELELNLFSLLFGDQIKINGIELIEPKVYVKVLEDGKANYDIAIADTSEVSAEEESSDFSIGIKKWMIRNGHIIYDDELYKVFMKLNGISHSGGGDFTQEQFDLKTTTSVDTAFLVYEESEFLSNKKLDVDLTLNISEQYGRYTFKDNNISVNDFTFSCEGYFDMTGDEYDMDIVFNTANNSFKSILSILPDIILAEYQELETEGQIRFDGFVKGKYGETSMPAFQINLGIQDGMFHYPDLPTSVSNVQMDLGIDNASGVIDQTSIDLRDFSMDMGGNPVRASLKIENLVNYPMKADLQASLNLGDLNKMFPVEGVDLKGIFRLNAKAAGTYDTIKNLIPTIEMDMKLEDGYVKSSEFPVPLEQLNVVANIKNTSGQMAETVIEVPELNLSIDGEALNAKMRFENLEDINWDVHVHGAISLDKLMKIYPMEGTDIHGKIRADVDTKGSMSALEAERYDLLPTNGTLVITNFDYTSTDVPQGVTISSASFAMTPEKLMINDYVGTLGKSDVNIQGQVQNYMGYALREGEILLGTMRFNSEKFDLNEWMITEEAEEVDEEIELEVVAIPDNIDFLLDTRLKEVKYDNLNIKDLAGKVRVKNGILRMDGIKFNTLGGAFTMDGTYDTQDIDHPKYDMKMGIDKLSIAKSYDAFNTVKAFAPVAKLIDGDFSSDFSIDGELQPNMMPNLGTINFDGLVEIAQAALVNSDLLSGLSSVTKLNQDAVNKVTLKDVVMKTHIEDGKLNVEPFNIKIGDYDAEVSGSYGLDNSMDYLLNVNVPAGELGSTLNSAMASLTGAENTSGNMIKLPVTIGGTYNNPSFSLGAAQATTTVKDEAKAKIKEETNKEIDKAKEEAEEKAEEELDEIKEKAKKKLKKLFGG